MASARTTWIVTASRWAPVSWLCLALATALVACGQGEKQGQPDRLSLISDQAHNDGMVGFYFVPPTVLQAPPRAGVFDPTVAVTARVCHGTGPCDARSALAVFTASGGTGGGPLAKLRVVPFLIVYAATWDTTKCAGRPCAWIPGSPYRLHVYRLNPDRGESELGYADLQVVRSKPPTMLNTKNFSPLVIGLPYVIAFRIDRVASRCLGVACVAQDQCHEAGTCDPTTGLCSSPVKSDGSACDDGDACSQTDVCISGACVGSNPVACVAQDQCHEAGTCDPTAGLCSSPVKSDGSACDDGDACSQTDLCISGACVGSNPVACVAQDQCHAASTCDPTTGACLSHSQPNGTACTDQNACTQLDTCQDGTCVGASPVTCVALDACHDAGVCDPASGTCTNPPKPGVCSASPSPFSTSALRLNEVGFLPPPGASAFAELRNVGTDDIALGGFMLANERSQVATLPAGVVLPAGKIALIWFDGSSGVEGLTLHARADLVVPQDGALTLLDPSGAIADKVAWGEHMPYSTTLMAVGLRAEIAPGSSVARDPLSSEPDPLAWSVLGPEEVSPGQSNPTARVAILIPFDGARVPPGTVRLSWYPAAGAVGYHVQVAQDSTFSVFLDDQTLTGLAFDTSSLSEGTYFWRVQALAADGSRSGFSDANRLAIDPEAASTPLVGASALSFPGASRAALAAAVTDQVRVVLPNFSIFSQHKDTELLLLESHVEFGAHNWNSDHGVLDANDPADMDCAAASISMVNHYFGGDLSQDRINYEVLHGMVAGPEGDLAYGAALNLENIGKALTYALGGAPLIDKITAAAAAEFWQLTRTEIDAGRPILMGYSPPGRPGHVVVIAGYRVDADGARILMTADPWNPGQAFGTKIDYELDKLLALGVFAWKLPAQPIAAKQEPEVQTDADGDGVVDFDEARRFHTDPDNPDTDHDGVSDLVDIRASVFDKNYGFSRRFATQTMRFDWDHDGLPMELDRDSDGDSCSDGFEDFNLNGAYDPETGESYNFYALDARCLRFKGTTVHDLQSLFADHHERSTANITWTPKPEQLVASSQGIVLLYPSGSIGVDVFETGGCVYDVSPRAALVGPEDGVMIIDYTKTPAVVSGFLFPRLPPTATVTSCAGFSSNIGGFILFGLESDPFKPLTLNAAGDEFVQTRITDTGSERTNIQYDYKIDRSAP